MARAAVILIENGAVAMIERDRGQGLYYILPGGQQEAGETIEETAIREAQEELGLEVELGPLIAEVTFQGSHQYYFLAQVRGGRFGEGVGPEMLGLYPEEAGTFNPVWLEVHRIPELDSRPDQLTRLIFQVIIQGQEWPEEVVRFHEG